MNGNINGEWIAKAVSGQTAEFESGNIFRGSFGSATTGGASSATPEPSTWISLLTALAAFAMFQKKRAIVKLYTK